MLRVLRNHRGSYIIEFMALSPLLILVAMMVWQSAVAGYGILRVQVAARDGVRVAATELDKDKAWTATFTSFGPEQKYYTLDSVNVSIDKVKLVAEVEVQASIHTVLLPKDVAIPYSYKVTTPIYAYEYKDI